MTPTTRRQVAAIVKRFWFEFRHVKSEWFNLLYWPFFDLLAWGLLTAFLRTGELQLPVPIAYLLGAALLWNVLYRVQQGVSLALMFDIWSSNLITIFASPITPRTYLLGAMAWTGLYLAVQFTIMTVLAFVVFQFGLLTLGIALVPFMAMLIMFGVAMGLVVIGIVIRVGHGANEMAWALVGMVQPLAAVYYPVSILPGWGQAIASFLPPSHIFEAMRSVVGGGPAPWGALALVFLMNLAYLGGALMFVDRMLAGFRARGQVTRYAA